MKTDLRQIHPQRRPQRVLKVVFTALVVVASTGAALFAYIWFSGDSGKASAAVSAPVLTVGGSTRLFRIQPAESEVRFVISETLLGQPKSVVGSTREVAGDIAVDFSAPGNSMVGVIRINVRTLNTDNEFRNRALRGQILQSTRPEFEFATFTPKHITGLPDKVMLGKSFSLQITGDLIVRGATREVTFEATVTPINSIMITGSAKAQVRFADFGLIIPEAPGVANVSESVRLEIDFAATEVEGS